MICPNCHSDNSESAQFCDNCGTKLQIICWQCQTANRPGAKFCKNCGHTLEVDIAQPANKRNQATLQAFMPRELAVKLEAAFSSQAMKGERRVVTMLFCDVKGSTAAAEVLDPEDWAEIINNTFEYMIRPIYHYGGTVARLMGDAILAFFGAPIAHEDDPQRAVLAGLSILEAMLPYREEVKQDWKIDIDVRVGINTGMVMVGAIGADLRMEYTAIGDAINLAARMEQTAEPGTIQISENTYKRIKPLFEFEALGSLQVKGKSKPVKTYRVLGRKSAPGSLRGLEGLDAPLIGRVQEKALIEQKIANLETGMGEIVFLTGEAGLGKSRLIRELHSRPQELDHEVTWYDTSSLSYETGQPYSLFRRLLRRVMGLEPEVSPSILQQNISKLSEEVPTDQGEILQRSFESLFGFRGISGDAPLVGEAFKGHLYTAMSTFWQYRASKTPAVLVFDDLHWTDPASADLLVHLITLTGQVPLLLLFAMRPEMDASGWKVRQMAESRYPDRFTEIKLKALDMHESEDLVDSLLRISDLPEGVRHQILKKSEGNPFFVEEVIRSLIDHGVLLQKDGEAGWKTNSQVTDIKIPDNLLSLLVARIDRLDEGPRHTLGLASVIGRYFHYRVLARIVQFKEQLADHLFTLQRADLIHEVTRVPELEYVFRHALTQEATYSTLLRKQRLEFHLLVGEAIEELFPEQVDEIAASLAYHFYQSRAFSRALKYYALAGDEAFRLHASTEAIEHYRQALACTNKVDVPSELLVHLYTRLGRSYELTNQFDHALDNYQEMLVVGSKLNDNALELASLTAQCVLRGTQTPLYDPSEARKLGERALLLSQELGDEGTEAKVLWGLLLVEIFSGGDNQKAKEYGQRSLAIAGKLGLKEQLGFTSTNLVNLYLTTDEMEAAREAGRRAREIWRELGNTPMLADSYNNAMWIEIETGDYQTSLSMGLEGMRLSKSIDNLWGYVGALNSLAPIYLETGDIAQALESLNEAIQMAKQADMLPLVYFGMPYLTLVYLTAGDFKKATQLANELYENRGTFIRAYLHMTLSITAQVMIQTGRHSLAKRILGEAYDAIQDNESLQKSTIVKVTDARLQLALKKPDAALRRMEPLVNGLRQRGMRRYLPESMWLQARALLALDQLEQARQALQDAQEVAMQTGARRMLWQILASRAQTEVLLGNEAGAERLYKQAQEVVADIANHTGSRELRNSFLARTDVQDVLEPGNY